jgi:hypothetical protein
MTPMRRRMGGQVVFLVDLEDLRAVVQALGEDAVVERRRRVVRRMVVGENVPRVVMCRPAGTRRGSGLN